MLGDKLILYKKLSFSVIFLSNIVIDDTNGITERTSSKLAQSVITRIPYKTLSTPLKYEKKITLSLNYV